MKNNEEYIYNRELNSLNSERNLSNKIIQGTQYNIANELLGEMGKDIDDVLSGKKKVKLSLMEKIKYSLRYYINKLFKLF